MIIITNRNVQEGKKPEELFGRKFHDKNPDELRLATSNKIGGEWKVDIIDEHFELIFS